MDPIIESEMTFGPYPDGHCFRIEGSDLHKSVGEGVKIVEFLKLRLAENKPQQVWLVEAKKSAPRADRHEYDDFIGRIRDEGHARLPDATESVNDFVELIREDGLRSFPTFPNDFDKYINDIREKMENALSLFFASRLKRHPDHENGWPRTFRDLDLETAAFRLVLVIKTARNDWLPPLSDALRKALEPMTKSWALGPNAVVVLTEEGAKKRGLVADA